MDYKQFRKQLSEATGHTLADTDTLVEAFAAVLRSCGTELDAVAVPSFGTFTTDKHDEEIRTDAATGRRTLVPAGDTHGLHPRRRPPPQALPRAGSNPQRTLTWSSAG